MQVTPGLPGAHQPLDTTVASAQPQRLTRAVNQLAGAIGPRNIRHYAALCSAADRIEAALAVTGYRPIRQSYPALGKEFHNIIAEQRGSARSADIVVVGAHYDTHRDSPGANDNASGIAALLEIALAARTWQPQRTLRFVAFTNEESPFTRTQRMGSTVYARACRESGDRVVAMLCLETLGCFSEEIGSQRLSLHGLLLPRRGNFLALVGNGKSRPLLNRVSATLRREGSPLFRAITLPSQLPGARSSDHWSFWKQGYQAVMATDTAPLRYRFYHTREDTPEKLNYLWVAQVVQGLIAAIGDLAHPTISPASSIERRPAWS
jgi:Zn-dependent M28 family amino/carboxypeptidase